MDLQKTRNTLMTLYCLLLLTAGTLYVLGDYVYVDMAFMATASDQSRFIISTTMILLTLALIPTALKLFRFKKVAAQLKAGGVEALRRWGILRITILGSLLVLNTLLYYALNFEPAFGYLAVVTLLTMPFVFPSINRCKTELEV